MKPYDPRAEMLLTARTGFLSKEIWSKYFASGKIAWRNRVWMNFIKRGVFKPHPSRRSGNVIVLNQENPVVTKLHGNEITTPPSVAVLDHDEIVIETFLRINKAHPLAFTKFEAELKRADLRDKRFIDPSDKTKYPDLLIRFNGPAAHCGIAIELELSRKDPKRYRQIMSAYMSNKDACIIVFVTDIESVENAIKTAIRDTYYPEWERPVGFASLKDWQTDPMTAKIRLSENVITLDAIRAARVKIPIIATVSAP